MNRPPQVGELVGMGAISGTTTASATAAVIEVMDPGSLVVEVDVPEARLGMVRVGGPCEVALDAFADRRLRGTVSELGRRVDRSKGTVPVRVRLTDATGVLPEMSARVSFLTEELAAEVRRRPDGRPDGVAEVLAVIILDKLGTEGGLQRRRARRHRGRARVPHLGAPAHRPHAPPGQRRVLRGCLNSWSISGS
jgi:hypothetical protein